MSEKFVQDMTAAEIAAMTDADVERAAYGIRHYDPSFGTPAQRANYAEHSGGLRARLDAIETAKKAAQAARPRQAVTMATCARCGCEFPARQAMSSSNGTVCPDCYMDSND